MGYRSDVAIVCEEEAFRRFREAWKKADFTPNSIMSTDGDAHRLYCIQYGSVKWYDEYREVKEIEDAMNEIQERHPDERGWNFTFGRIGEDDDDNEFRRNGYDAEMYLTRTFAIPRSMHEVRECDLDATDIKCQPIDSIL